MKKFILIFIVAAIAVISPKIEARRVYYKQALDSMVATADTTFILNPGWNADSRGKIHILVEVTAIDTVGGGGTTKPTYNIYRSIDGVNKDVFWAKNNSSPDKSAFTLPLGDTEDYVWVLSQDQAFWAAFPEFYGDSVFFEYKAENADTGWVSVYIFADKE